MAFGKSEYQQDGWHSESRKPKELWGIIKSDPDINNHNKTIEYENIFN